MPSAALDTSVLAKLFGQLQAGVTVWNAPTDDPAEVSLAHGNPAAAMGHDDLSRHGRGRTMAELYPASMEAPPHWNVPKAIVRVATTGVGELMERLPYGGDGRPAGFYNVQLMSVGDRLVAAVHENVTERMLAEDRLHRRTEELARSNRELEQFGSAVSHDLQSPLRVISGFAHLLGDGLEELLDERRVGYLKAVFRGVDDMERLIADLLQFARLQGAEELRRTVDLGTIVEEVVRTLEPFLDEANAVVEWDGLPEVVAVPAHMRQLLQNLLENSLKYRRPGVPARIYIDAERRDDVWSVSVTDNGVGIAPQHAERVFKLFKRLVPGREGGTGLGLALCRKIVELTGGHIWVETESPPTHGTILRFDLPAHTA